MKTYRESNRRSSVLLSAVLFLLLSAITPAQASPRLHLEASTVRSEFLAGETFTVSAYLFNDGDELASAAITIAPPAGFEALPDGYETADAGQMNADTDMQNPIGVYLPGSSAVISPGGSLHANFSYRVSPVTPLGLARFVVTAVDDAGAQQFVTVVIQVCCIESAGPEAATVWRVYVPAFR